MTTSNAERDKRPLLVLSVVLLIVMVAGFFFWRSAAGLALEPEGLEDGETVGAPALDGLQFVVSADSPEELGGAVLTLNDEDVTDEAEIDGDVLRYRPSDLPDGEHELKLRIDRDFPRGNARQTWSFEVDTEPPGIVVTEPAGEVPWGEPMTLAGTAEGAEEVTIDAEPVELDGDAFAVDFEQPPGAPLEIAATDELGNTASTAHEVAVTPREPPGMQGVHVTAYGWADPRIRDPIMEMVEDGVINTIQLDVKDEDGAVGYDSQVPLAQESGAALGVYDIDEALAELREHDVHIVGRIVAFADPILTRHLWEAGERDKVIQTPGGERYTGAYSGFSNFADPAVRQYNIDLAVEAAEAGFDDILYDYVRRPDGSLDNMVIPGLETTPEEAIVEFVAESRKALAGTQAWLGASVYGIAADRPTQIGQDIAAISEHVDYVAPMVYPSHWGPGEYGVDDPNSQPYDIVHESLKVFQEVTEGTDARIVPWLQDFSLGVTYGPAEIRAQTQAAADLGIEEYLMWNAASRYTRAGLEEAEDVVDS